MPKELKEYAGTIIASLAFLLQLAVIIFYAGKLDSRVGSLEMQSNMQRSMIENRIEKEIYIRDRSEVLSTLEKLEGKIDKLIDIQLKGNK